MTHGKNQPSETDAELAQLDDVADAAKRSADRACAAIDDALRFIEASNTRIAEMEKVTHRTARKTA